MYLCNGVLVTPFSRWESRGTESISNLHKAMQRLCMEADTWGQASFTLLRACIWLITHQEEELDKDYIEELSADECLYEPSPVLNIF